MSNAHSAVVELKSKMKFFVLWELACETARSRPSLLSKLKNERVLLRDAIVWLARDSEVYPAT